MIIAVLGFFVIIIKCGGYKFMQRPAVRHMIEGIWKFADRIIDDYD